MENGMVDGMKKNRVLVSNSKKSLFFYVNLSKDFSVIFSWVATTICYNIWQKLV
ncbi:hypothetical protein OROHE_013904 [Orobanche hederae]